MKILLKLLPLFLLFTSCSFFEENATEKLSAKLSLNLEVYTTGGSDEITASVVVYGGTGNHEISWKAGDGEYKEGSDTKNFGVFNDSAFQIFYCRIVDGEDTVYEQKRANANSLLNDTPLKRFGRLQVNDDFKLADEHGFPVQLRGMSTHGLQYFGDDYEGDTLFVKALAKDWNVDIIRLAMYADEHGYVSGDRTRYNNMIDEIVEEAEEQGIYVMIDWHILSPGDPNLNEEVAIEFFTYMAKKHGAKKNVIFEICNEPNDMGAYDSNWNHSKLPYHVSWLKYLKPYGERMIQLIRQYSENVVVVGTPDYASSPHDVVGNKIDDKNTMYTLHFYAGSHPSDGPYMSNLLTALEGDVPVFVTEFGTQTASGDGVNDFVSSQEWLDTLEKYGVSWCNWNFSDDFRSGAVFKDWVWNGTFRDTISNYSDTAMMKESGKWIFDQFHK